MREVSLTGTHDTCKQQLRVAGSWMEAAFDWVLCAPESPLAESVGCFKSVAGVVIIRSRLEIL